MSSLKFEHAGLTAEGLAQEHFGNGNSNGSSKNGHSTKLPSSNGSSSNGKSIKHNEEEVPLNLRGNEVNPYTYELIHEIAAHIQTRISLSPKIAIICGSGLGGLADGLDEKVDLPYETIPHFPQSTVQGHAGKLVVGKMGNVPVICMQGRFHFYEGYSLYKCAMPVRVFKALGVEMMIVTNAAGGLNPNFKVGDVMIIKDHVNLPGISGVNSLRGPNDERWGPRFLAMNRAYDKELRIQAKNVAKELGMRSFIHEGVYTMLGGPTFETVAELRLMRLLGIDAVGMSTVPEVVTAHHCGMKCFGFSLITNECVTCYDTDEQPDHEEVMQTAKNRGEDLVKFVTAFINTVTAEDLPKK